MRKAVTVIGVISVVLLGSGLALTQGPQSAPMTFFITSNGSGEGADLGGLAGADAICQRLATDVGAGDGIVRLIRLDPKNLQSRTIRLQVDATRPGRRLGLV